MDLPNIFTSPVSDKIIQRINALTTTSQPVWGKMNVAQMLAHCNVTYEYLFENNHPKPNAFLKFIIKLMAKKAVVSNTPYKKNSPTGPDFKMTTDKDFATEKSRLISYLQRTQALGENHFDGKESHSFGELTLNEWNNMFYKHLDHHLTQFGV